MLFINHFDGIFQTGGES